MLEVNSAERLSFHLSWTDFIIFFYHLKSTATLKKAGNEGEKSENEEDEDADLVCDVVLYKCFFLTH